MSRDTRPPMTDRRIVRTYLSIVAVSTLAQALIWGVNTLFLLDAGLDIFGVMVANAAYAAAQVVFEVPTGVVADTLGRRASYLLCMGVLLVSTLLYVWFGAVQAGLPAFVLASVLLGLGFTFFTGAVEAWMVDALGFVGFTGKMDPIFARGGIAQGLAMLVGTIGGGFLGQIDLTIPYIARAVLLVPAALLGLLFMHDLGFTPRPLKWSTIGRETRAVAKNGVTYGWRNPVVRPLMLANLIAGVFFMFGFYSWQRYFLDLLERDLIWVNGVIAALVGLSTIAGNLLVGPLSRTRLRSSTIVFSMLALQAVVIVLAGLLQYFWVAVPLYLVASVAFGLLQPVRQAWLNRRIPSEQRATIISLDALFLDAGGAGGQVGLGYLSRAVSIPMAWIVGGAFQLTALPFVWRARRAAAANPLPEEEAEAERLHPPELDEPAPAPDCSQPLARTRVC